MLCAVLGQLRRDRAPTGVVVLLAIAIVASACGLMGTSAHVRDTAGLFSADARATAEERLRELASERGVLLYVITGDEAHPPRMTDALDEADARGLPAIAVLIGPNGIDGLGQSGVEFSFDPPSAAHRLLDERRADEALDALVEHFAAWSLDPRGNQPDVPPPAGRTPAP